MKRKELAETFKMISNSKNTFDLLVYIKIFQNIALVFDIFQSHETGIANAIISFKLMKTK